MVCVEAISARIRVRDNDLFYLLAIVGVHRRMLMVLVFVIVVEVVW